MRVLSVDSTPELAGNLPAELRTHAVKLARQDALSLDDAGRGLELAEIASEVEAYLQRLVVPVARTVTTVLAVDGMTDAIPIMPRWPDVAGVTLEAQTVRVWKSGAWADANHALRPAGRVELKSDYPGEFEFAATATPRTEMPGAFVEAVARLYAMRTTTRPGDADSLTGAQFNLSNALFRSGASELLASIRSIR